MPLSFDRQRVNETYDPLLNLPEVPQLMDFVKANGWNSRAVVEYDKKMVEWRQRLQQELSRRFSAIADSSVSISATPATTISTPATPSAPAGVVLFNQDDLKYYRMVLSGSPPVESWVEA